MEGIAIFENWFGENSRMIQNPNINLDFKAFSAYRSGCILSQKNISRKSFKLWREKMKKLFLAGQNKNALNPNYSIKGYLQAAFMHGFAKTYIYFWRSFHQRIDFFVDDLGNCSERAEDVHKKNHLRQIKEVVYQ